MAEFQRCFPSVTPPAGDTGNQALSATRIISGEPLPDLPNFNEDWIKSPEGMKVFVLERERYDRKIHEYLRRLSAKLALNNLAQDPGGTPGDPGVMDVLVNWRYNKTTHRFQGRYVRVRVNQVIEDIGWRVLVESDQPVRIPKVVTDILAVDGGLTKSNYTEVYALEALAINEDLLVASCFKACSDSGGDPLACPVMDINLDWHDFSSGTTATFEFDTNSYTEFLFDAGSDDIVVLIKDETDIAAEIVGSDFNVTIPPKYIMFRDTTGHLGRGDDHLTWNVTDGTLTTVILGSDTPDDDGNPRRHVAGMSEFTSRAWTTPVTSAELISLGMVDGDGIARLKFAGAGDEGHIRILSCTCTPV